MLRAGRRLSSAPAATGSWCQQAQWGGRSAAALSTDASSDGSIVLLPTPGHLDGSLSVFLRVDPPILFVADLCYRSDLLINEHFPGKGEHELLAQSWPKVRALKARLPDLLIVPSHEEDVVTQILARPLANNGR